MALQALPEPEYYEKLNGNNQQFLYSIMVVTIIMAIGGVLGVMNTMFAAISQRSKDIGVLRLLGFTRWQVTVSFLLESLAIGVEKLYFPGVPKEKILEGFAAGRC